MFSEMHPPKTTQLTKRLLQEFMSLPPLKGDRPLRESRLKSHAAKLEKGYFFTPVWAKCYCEDDQTWYRVNGQHTSHLFASLDDLPQGLSVVMYAFTAPNLEGVTECWAQFDAQESSRTGSEIVGAEAARHEELSGLPCDLANMFASGLAMGKSGDGYFANLSPLERGRLLGENINFVLWAWRLLGSRTSSRTLARTPVVAAMYLTWSKNRSAADQFWGLVKSEAGPTPGSPDRMLARWLTVISVRNGAGAKAPLKDQAKPREILHKCLYAWNAWRRGSEGRQILKYIHSAPLPKVI